MMELREFAETIKNRIKDYLPISYVDAETETRTVIKNNGVTLIGLCIRGKEMSVAPTIYLEKFYTDYQNGTDINDILNMIAKVRVRNEASFGFDINNIRSWDFCSERIFPRLVNHELNGRILEERPHRIIEDLAVTYYIDLSEEELQTDGDKGSIAVNNDLAAAWGVDEEDLNRIALKNLHEKSDIVFQSLNSMVQSLLSDGDDRSLFEDAETDSLMYILTTGQKLNGFTLILDKEVMHKISRVFPEGYYLIPSSIHEALIVPKSEKMELHTLEEMVYEVNRSTVDPEIRVSDHIYTYEEGIGLKIAA